MAEDEKPQNVRNILVIAAADQSEVGSQGQVQTFVPPRLAKLHTELVKLRQQNRLSQAMPMSQAVWGQVGPVVKEVEKAISQWRVRPELQRRNKLDEDLGKLRTLDADLGKLRKPGQQTVLSQESQDKLAQGLVPVKGLLDELIGHSAQTRALLKVTGDKLLELADNAYSFTFDLLEAPPGPTGYHMDLQCALLNYLENRDIQCAIPNVPNYRYRYDRKSQFQYPVNPGLERPTPDVIVPIASAPTRAARAVVRRLSPGNKIPIVFTVVSDPGGEPLDDPLVDPSTWKGDGITGVSRSLIQTVRECLDRFRDLLGDDHEIHWFIRPLVHQADKAHSELTGSSARLHDLQTRTFRESRELVSHDITDLDRSQILQFIRDKKVLPPNKEPRKTRTGLLVIPDELVVSIADEVIATAQAPGRRIPTFFQQLEYVMEGPWTKEEKPQRGTPKTPAERLALAGYGLPPEILGHMTAEYVHKVLHQPDQTSRLNQASQLPVLFPGKFKFWINLEVAKELGIESEIVERVRLRADRTFP